MAKNLQMSTKRLQIDKANTTIVIAVGIAAAVATFSLVASRSLIARQSYQSKVIEAREQARDQLQTNIEAVSSLKVAYKEFVNRPENVIGGSSTGNSDRDGDNGRIVLDSLPSKYDYPALASSLEKILSDRNYNIVSITGTDDEANQNSNGATNVQTEAAPTIGSAGGISTTPTTNVAYVGKSVEMPFEIGARGSYPKMLELLGVFKSSIRPLHVMSLSITAGSEPNSVQLSVKGKSFYQPEKSLEITQEVVQ